VPPLTPPDPPLTDGVVKLRGFRDDDADAIAEMMDDEEMSRWTRTPWPYRRPDAVEWLESQPGLRERGSELNLAIVDASNDELAGSMGLRFRDDARGELGYLVARWARRREFGSRALRLYAGWAFEELGLGRLEILIRPENEASRAMAESVGFRREGVLRSHTVVRGERADMVIYGLLPGELRPP
jgi:RimJ/RimL family protein N-acetyltransferase